MSKKPVRSDRAHARPSRRPYILLAEQLEVRDLLAADLLPQADLLEGELTPTIAADASALVYANGSTATNSGTFADAANLSASVGAVIDNGNGTWTWTLGDVQVSDTQTVTITADDGASASVEATFELTVKDPAPMLIADLNPGYANSLNHVVSFLSYDGFVYFAADTPEFDVELWRTDGTAAGTALVKDFTPGPGLSSTPTPFVFNDSLYILASVSNGPQQLWKSDGTPEGTVPVPLSDGNLNYAASIGAGPFIIDGILYLQTSAGFARFDGTDTGIEILDSRFFENLTFVGDVAYMTLTSNGYGDQLWKWDGGFEGAQLVADISPSSPYGRFGTLFSFDDHLFFTATVSPYGWELWTSDGTAAGTKLFVEIIPGSNSYPSVRSPVVVGDALYFVGYDEEHGWEVWKSDGTVEGTGRVTNLPGFANGSNLFPSNLTAFNGELIFSLVNDSLTTTEIYRTDGTVEGTTKIGESVPQVYAHFKPLAIIDGFLYFSELDTEYGFGLWRIDGTSVGTERVANFTSAGSSNDVVAIAKAGDRLIVAAFGPEGREPFSIDLTAPPTARIEPPRPIGDGENILFGAKKTIDYVDKFTELQFAWDLDGDGLFDDAFGPTPVVARQDLPIDVNWTIGLQVTNSSGAIANTTLLVGNMAPYVDVDQPLTTTAEGEMATQSGIYGDLEGDVVTLSASVGVIVDNGDGTWSWSLASPNETDSQTVVIYASDGTSQSQIEFSLSVENVAPGLTLDDDPLADPNSSFVTRTGTYSDVPVDTVTLSASAGYIVDNGDGTWTWTFDMIYESEPEFVTITANDGEDQTQLSFELTSRHLGPILITDALTDLINWKVMEGPNGPLILYVTRTADYVYQFWISNGTPQGEVLLKEFDLGYPYKPNYRLLTFQDEFYFSVLLDGRYELWKTDGTANGTIFIDYLAGLPDLITPLDDAFYYVATVSNRYELWKHNGAPGGGTPVGSFAPTSSVDDFHLERDGETGGIYIAYRNANAGWQLWRSSDGVMPPTLIYQFPYLDISYIKLVGDRLFLSVINDPQYGRELWVSDGTQEGTKLLYDTVPGTAPSSQSIRGHYDGVTYFQAYDSTNGWQLWKTDGTTEGTSQITAIAGGTGNYFDWIGYFDGNNYFVRREENGWALWLTSDTDPSGMVRLALLDIPYSWQRVGSWRLDDGSISFTMLDPATNSYVTWRTDGTIAGTTPISAFRSNPNSSLVYSVTQLQDRLLIFASSASGNLGIWSNDFAPVPYAQIAPLKARLDDGKIVLSAQGSFEFGVSAANLTFDWDLDGDGQYDDGQGFELLYDPAQVPISAPWNVGLRVTDPEGQIATRRTEISNATPDFTADYDALEIREGGTARNGGRYLDTLGENLQISASLGTAKLNSDGTWSWSYFAPDGPKTESVLITLDDGTDTRSIRFPLTITNVAPFLSAEPGTSYAVLGGVSSHIGIWSDRTTDVVSLSASIGEVKKNVNGTWTWSYVSDSQDLGDHTVTITADDAEGGVTQISFPLTVLPQPEAFLTINDPAEVPSDSNIFAMLPENLALVDEWDALTLHVWARRDERSTDEINGATYRLHYNSDWFQFDSFTSGGVFGQLAINDTGDALEVVASAPVSGIVSKDNYVLLGALRFKPNPSGGVPNDATGEPSAPIADLQFSLSDVRLTSPDLGTYSAAVIGSPTTQMRIVPYDLDDDGSISLVDLTKVISQLGGRVANSPELAPYDFDGDGYVSLVDLVYLIRNIGATPENGVPILFPEPPTSQPLVETESLTIQTAASSLLEGEAIPLSLPSSDEHNVDAAFGNLSLLEECWEFPSDGEEEEELVEAAASFSTSDWQPEQLPDWALQASSLVDCFADKAISLLEELEEEHPRLERAARWLKNRLEDF